MKRLIEKMVCLGLVTAWRLATWPTSRSPSLVKATTDGVVRPPSALGMTTTAEGVETLELVETLVGLGCDVAQGYYFARPLPADEAYAYFKARNA